MQVFASSLRAVGAHNFDGTLPRDARGMLYHVSYTAEGAGTSTLDVKMQYYDETTATYEDYTDWENNVIGIVQMTGVGEGEFLVYPGIGQDVVANHPLAGRRYSAPHPRKFRIVATVGTDTVTFSINGTPLA